MTDKIQPCRFCGKPPGTKVGPPAMARCVNKACQGILLAAITLDEWNAASPRPSSGSAEALEYLSVFTDSGYYGLSNVQVRAICAALRTPALPSGEVDESPPLEVWNGDRKVTVYEKDVIRIWGVDMEAEMSSEQRDHQTVADAFDWLYANGPASSPAPQAQPQSAPPFSRWADIIKSASLTISPKGSKELDALAAEVVREALAPFIKALAGVPATVNDAAPFARVSNDAIAPGTMNIITFGEIRKLLAVLSPQAQAGPSLQKTQGSPAQAGAAAQGSRPRDFLAWAVKMFGPVAKLRSERLMRFAEEAIELAHAEGMERSTINLITDRVYSLPAGNVGKEIGQAQACLETFAENIGLSSADEAEREWQRVQEIPQEEWTRRHSAKQALGIALPSTEGK